MQKSDCVRPFHRTGIAFFVWAFVLSLSTLLGACAQDDDKNKRSAETLRQALQNPQAMKIAQERFQMVKRYSANHDWPISRMRGEFTKKVLFPIGRSDKMYVFISYDSSFSCYERKNGKNKRVYQVHLIDKTIPAKNRKAISRQPYTSLMDSLTDETTGVEGSNRVIYRTEIRGSQFAKNDLAKKQEYVQYNYDCVIGVLRVSLLSEKDTDDDTYSVDRDHFTWESFHTKYGLPVARPELALLSK